MRDATTLICLTRFLPSERTEPQAGQLVIFRSRMYSIAHAGLREETSKIHTYENWKN